MEVFAAVMLRCEHPELDPPETAFDKVLGDVYESCMQEVLPSRLRAVILKIVSIILLVALRNLSRLISCTCRNRMLTLDQR